ncbi:MAG: ABC transporter ATP-binding protein/permease [Oscillospiraceae bacterium]|nr:ABC transporter ATP-binding protein/permease [Oscillospiraceae bacterium]
MFQKVRPYMGEYMKYTKRAAVSVTIAVILSVIPYFLLYQIIAPLTEGQSIGLGFVLWRVVLTALCLIGNAVLYVHGLELSHISAYNTLKALRTALQGKLEKQPLGVIRELGNGRIKKVFTDDIETIELLLAHAIPEGIGNLATPAAVLIAMFFADWKLALLSLAALPIGMLAMGMMFKLGMSRMEAYYAAAAKMNNTIIEYINGMEVVKVFNRDGESYARFEHDIQYYRDMTLDWYKVCWPWMALYSSILPCVALFTLPIGGWFVLKGWSTLANFILVLCMSFGIGAPLIKAMSFGGKVPQLNYKIDELERLLDHPSLKSSNRAFEGENHDIRFEDVHFTYKEDEVIHGIDLEIKEGEMVALVGESGSGKSTLARLLVHFYDLDSGRITLGGQDITDMRVEELNDQISFVSQEQFLFNTTLYENIRIGKPGASREEVLEAARLAQCDEFLSRFPKGIDTPAGDSGKMLSGGERQRISLARALLKNAPVIVLDEATAFIDPENEEKMNAAISEVIRGKTVLIIAHRLHTVVGADKIVVLDKGCVEAEGTHEKLLQNSRVYPRLWAAAEKSVAWEVRA